MNEQYENQTQFSFEEPMLEGTQEIRSDSQEKTSPTGKKNRNIIIITLLVLFSTGLIIAGLSLDRNETAVETISEVEEVPITIAPDDPLALSIKQLQLELQEQDPARRDLSFPSINLEIRLDPKPRR